jgi:hypothetical protein
LDGERPPAQSPRKAPLGDDTQVASQQLPDPATPPFAAQRSALDFVEQWFTTGGHIELSVHMVTPSSQTPLVQVPGLQIAQVTKPDFFPHVERAAHRVTAPLQFPSSSLFLTAAFT